MSFPDGRFVEGDYQDGVFVRERVWNAVMPRLAGPDHITFRMPDGKLTLSQIQDDGRPTHAKIEWDDGRRYDGGWSPEGAAGDGEYRDNAGEYYTGGWLNGRCSGQGKRVTVDATYDGSWVDGRAEGQGVMTTTSGLRVEATFSAGAPTSGRLTFSDGTTFRGTFFDGQPQSGEYFDRTGQPIRPRGDGDRDRFEKDFERPRREQAKAEGNSFRICADTPRGPICWGGRL